MVIVLVLAFCVWSIDIALPDSSLSSINGMMYVVAVSAFIFLDAVKSKSRMFVIVIGIIFVLININNIYDRIFRFTEQGAILLKYTIQGTNMHS